MMKPITPLLFVALFAAAPLQAQTPNSCNAPELVRRHYLNSAKILALRQMLGDPAWADSVYIPAALYTPMLDALSAVYNATQYPERDTVTDCLDIRAFPFPISPLTLSLVADTTLAWAKNLYIGISPTGNATVDDLIMEYQLQKTNSFQFDKFVFYFQTQEPLNTAALAARFNSVPGAHADPDGFIGDGNDISADTVAGGLQLTYRVGWGNCPAGCISDRRWTFLVKSDCSVSFVKVEGEPLANFVTCTGSFHCATEPLCLAWLHDTLVQYMTFVSGCPANNPPINLTLNDDILSGLVLGVHVFIGIDAAFTDFFYCDGAFIGRCSTTIAGGGCDPQNLIDYFYHSDTIWNCTYPLPTPANCKPDAVHEQALDLSWQLAPNPSTGAVMVQADFGKRTRGRLSVLDLLGKTVWEKEFDTAQVQELIDLSRHSAGWYTVQLKTGGKVSAQKLVLVRG